MTEHLIRLGMRHNHRFSGTIAKNSLHNILGCSSRWSDWSLYFRLLAVAQRERRLTRQLDFWKDRSRDFCEKLCAQRLSSRCKSFWASRPGDRTCVHFAIRHSAGQCVGESPRATSSRCSRAGPQLSVDENNGGVIGRRTRAHAARFAAHRQRKS